MLFCLHFYSMLGILLLMSWGLHHIISWCGILWLYNIAWGSVRGSDRPLSSVREGEESLGPKLGGRAKAASESKIIIAPLTSLLPLFPPSLLLLLSFLPPHLVLKGQGRRASFRACHEWPTCVLVVYLPGGGLYPRASTGCGHGFLFNSTNIYCALVNWETLCWRCQRDAERQSPSWEGRVWGPCLRSA